MATIYYKNGSTFSQLTAADFGAALSSHTHAYLPLTGGTMTGSIKIAPSGADRSLELSYGGVSYILPSNNGGFAGGLYFYNMDSGSRVSEGSLGWFRGNYYYCGSSYDNPNGRFKCGTIEATLVGKIGTSDVGNSQRPIWIQGGTVTALTKVAVSYGGTGGTTAAEARTNLGISSGTTAPDASGTPGFIYIKYS